MSSPEVLPKPQQVVRAVVVSLVPKDQLWNTLSTNEDPNFLSFYIGKKEGRYTLLGGKVDPNEAKGAAAQKEVIEEAGLTELGLPKTVMIEDSYSYTFSLDGRYNKTPRDVSLIYSPVLPSVDLDLVGEGILAVEALSLTQFTDLIKTGLHNNIPMEGHLAINGVDSAAEFDGPNKIKKNRALTKTIQWMTHIEDWLKKKFIEQGDFETKAEFDRFYELLVANMVTNGWNVGEQSAEINRKVEGSKLHEALDEGHHGKDILYFLPFLAKNGLGWEGLGHATEATQIFVEYSKTIFEQFCKENMLGLNGEKLLEILRNPNSRLLEVQGIRVAFDAYVRSQLIADFSLSHAQMMNITVQVHNFLKEVSTELKLAEPALAHMGIYQDASLVNENANASAGTSLLNFLGLFDNKKAKSAELIQLEAGRQWLFFLKASMGMNHFETENAKMNNSIIQCGVNDFFGGIVEEKDILLSADKVMRINIRELNGVKVIVDEKPRKSFASYLRKSFYERVSDIADFMAYSIILEGNDETDGPGAVERIKAAKSSFMSYLKEQLSPKQGANNTYIYETDPKDTTLSYLETQAESLEGKRIGSQSPRIPRLKSVIHFSPDGKKEVDEDKAEIAWYPFETLAEGYYWGWTQKIADDANYVARRMLAGSNGLPSFYHLLYPVETYNMHYKNVIKHAGYFR